MKAGALIYTIGLAFLVAACGESPSGVVHEIPDVAHSMTARHSGVRTFDITVNHKGKIKQRRIRLDHGQRRLEIQSLNAPGDACQVDDPFCRVCPIDDPDCWQDEVVSGESSVYTEEPSSDVAAAGDGEWGPYFCPAYVDSPHFTWRGHHFGQALEDVRIVKVQNLYAANGIPRARYRFPGGSYVSDDGRAQFNSGTIDASCFVQQRYVLGFRVTAGWMTYGTFRGDIRELGGGGEGSFISYNSGSGFADLPEDARRVLETYLFSGQCTEGWAIVVDNQRVC